MKPNTLNFRVRRMRKCVRLTFTAPSELDGVTSQLDFEVDMTDDELRKLYDEAAKAVACASKANKRAKRVLAEQEQYEMFKANGNGNSQA